MALAERSFCRLPAVANVHKLIDRCAMVQTLAQPGCARAQFVVAQDFELWLERVDRGYISIQPFQESFVGGADSRRAIAPNIRDPQKGARYLSRPSEVICGRDRAPSGAVNPAYASCKLARAKPPRHRVPAKDRSNQGVVSGMILMRYTIDNKEPDTRA